MSDANAKVGCIEQTEQPKFSELGDNLCELASVINGHLNFIGDQLGVEFNFNSPSQGCATNNLQGSLMDTIYRLRDANIKLEMLKNRL